MPKKIGNQTFYSTEEVATVIGMSYETVIRRIRNDKIKATLFGTAYFVSRDDLVSHLSEMNLPESIIEYRLKKKVDTAE